MVESIVEWLTSNLTGAVSKELIVFLISMFPILELRGGLIGASILGIPYMKGIVICILGNMIPIPFILLFITPIFTWMKKQKIFRPMVEKLEKKSMGKSEKIQKYEFWGLLLFVGIPLPGTGAWTGALIASLLDVDKKKAILAIYSGLFLATAIMCFVVYTIPWLLSLF